MMTRLDELSRADQRLIRAGRAQPAKTTTVSPARRRTRSPDGRTDPDYRCQCGATFATWAGPAGAETHAHTLGDGHRRIAMFAELHTS